MSVLVPLIVRAVGDSFYKVSAEALTVTLSLIRVLRPSHPSACLLDFTPFVSAIYDAVADKLKATDIDQVGIYILFLLMLFRISLSCHLSFFSHPLSRCCSQADFLLLTCQIVPSLLAPDLSSRIAH